MCQCSRHWSPAINTHLTLGLAITSTWSTSFRCEAGSLACKRDCNIVAAPLNIKPPPINRTELYILRLVSSVAVYESILTCYLVGSASGQVIPNPVP